MKIIVATDSFKGCLTADQACGIIADVIVENLPQCTVVVKPMADGGEGTAQAMIKACNGQWIRRKVMGPLPEMEVEGGFAWFENTSTALVEMACASGITLLRDDQLNPMLTTTYGTGQLIKAALDKQPREILLAIGGSATVDAGVGAAIALGWEFLDHDRKPIGPGGGEIERIEKIVPPSENLQLNVKVLSDVDNPLCGPNGAAEVYGPQKGADGEMVLKLDAAIVRLAVLIKDQLGVDVASIAGAGAAGGLGAAAVAFMNGNIVSGIEAIIETMDIKTEMENADWVITGEGKLDSQSLQGKVISGIVQLARQTDTKVIAIAGDVQLSRQEYNEFGIQQAYQLKKEGMTTEHAMVNSEKLLKDSVCEFINEKVCN